MKLIQMQAFREIMLTGSVSEAARNLHRSQPAISALIAGLEEELDLKLFERRNGRLHPVPEAHYLLQECSEVLGRVSTLQENIKSIKTLKSGRIEVVSMPGPSVFLLPNVVSEFVSGKPDIECELISRSSDIVYQLVAAQQYDLGIADYIEGKAEDSSLVKCEVFRFDCLCALHRDDPLTTEDVITPDMLDGRPLASLYPEHEVFSNMHRVFSEANCSHNIKFTTRYFIPLLTFIENNLACGLVDPMSVESYRLYSGAAGSIVFKPFYPKVHYRSSVITPAFRAASLLTQSFTDLLRKRIISLGGVAV
ncbi:MAG: LysR substrate-binding domain-containing protein [Pseudomonadota bacterium]